MSDLFHESIPFEQIDQVFAVMALTLRHTYQILTKRPERMLEYLRNAKNRVRVAAVDLGRAKRVGHAEIESSRGTFPAACSEETRLQSKPAVWEQNDLHTPSACGGVVDSCQWDWPLPHVWLGATVENQKAVETRAQHLYKLHNRSWRTFYSVEPLLDRVELYLNHERVDWVIVGGESGHGARPFDLDWARSLIQQCKDAEVPVFIKQLGANCVGTDTDGGFLLGSNQTSTPLSLPITHGLDSLTPKVAILTNGQKICGSENFQRSFTMFNQHCDRKG
jgi:protein gp37